MNNPAIEARPPTYLLRELGTAARILIVDYNLLFADLLRLSLDAHGMPVLPIATTGAEALEAARFDTPALVLLEIFLPDGSGLSVGSRILERCPDTKVLVLSDVRDHKLAGQALAIGFHGYLTKDMPFDRLVNALQAALDGQVVMSPALARAAPSVEDLLVKRLTVREREVFGMLVEGLNNRDIALNLYVSLHTVRSHVQSVLAKLQVHSRLEAVAFAIRHGILRTLQNDTGDGHQDRRSTLGAGGSEERQEGPRAS
ncbi:MAG TPA: response regulator transcription factor [Acidimicrobiia bacterium]|nr:response regulator transcription factor [Acidimicrobiia bacterium]